MVRVALIEDHQVVRAGLALLIGQAPDMEVVGEAGTCFEGRRLIEEEKPDVAVMDLLLPDGSSLQILDAVRDVSPSTRVLVLTGHDNTAHRRSAKASGTAGFLAKGAPPADLLEAVRTVAQGGTYPEQGDVVEPEQGTRAPAKLSAREREVLILLAQGYTNRAAAEQLHISVKTVETYRARLRVKLGLIERADIVRYALAHGLIE